MLDDQWRRVDVYLHLCPPDTWWLYPQHVLRHLRSLLTKRVRATSALRARGKRASAGA